MIYGWMTVKLIHVLAGIFWLGSALLVTAFILPTAQKLGPQAGPFMNHLMNDKKLPVYITGASGLTFLSGLLLYWRVSDGFAVINWQWPGGLSLMMGMISGTIVFLWGHMVQSRNAKRLTQLTAGLTGPPTPDQAAAIQALQSSLRKGGWFGVVLLLISAVGMAMIHV